MASSSYDAALARLLAHEGGYTNHPADPGGPTNFGITIADYRKYVKHDATAADVRAMRLDQAKAIYRAHYWNALRCDEMPAGVDDAAFDYGVNSGVARVIGVLQRLLGAPADDRVTDALLARIGARDAAALVTLLCDERLAFLKRLKTWPVFGAGWSRRVAEVRSAALDMVAQAKVAGSRTKPEASPRTAAETALAAIGLAIATAAHQAGAHRLVVGAFVAAVLALGGWIVWRSRYGNTKTQTEGKDIL
jgi:lysozyme family protein